MRRLLKGVHIYGKESEEDRCSHCLHHSCGADHPVGLFLSVRRAQLRYMIVPYAKPRDNDFAGGEENANKELHNKDPRGSDRR